MSAVVYRRAPHAAHYGYGHPAKGHDLESWDVVQLLWESPRPDGVPADAVKNHGYVKDGVQHFVYVRRAPLSAGGCDRCAASTSAKGASR